MIARTPMFILILLVSGFLQAGAQGGSPYNFIFPVVDKVETDAGMPVQIPVFLENRGTTPVTLNATVSGDPEFSMDSVSQSVSVNPGMLGVALVHFVSSTAGSYSTLLTVTDGTLTDTLTLTAVVNPPPGPFILLPPYHDMMVDIGTPVQIPVTIKNVTSSHYSVTLSLTGDNEFSYSGNTTVSLAANASETVYVDFQSAVEGRFAADLVVSDGSYTTGTMIGVFAMDRPYKWIVPFQDDFDAMAGMEIPIPVFVQNTAATPVTLSVALSGDPEFSLDPASRQVTVDQGEDLQISFLSTATGVYSTLLTVTDGVDTDSMTITVTVHPGPGNFYLMPEVMDFAVMEQASFTAEFLVQNLQNAATNLSVSLHGDPQFSYNGSSPISLPANDKLLLDVDFSGAPTGVYSAVLYVTDGSETDSALVTATVGDPHTSVPLFTLQYDGKDFFFPFEAAPGATVTKDLTITNISGAELTVQLEMFSDSSFTISRRSVTIDSASSETVQITFDNNYGGFGDGMLVIDGGVQVEHIFLAGFTRPWTDYDGLLVMNELDFGMVDTATQVCLDVMLENTTQSPITISDIKLSGFSSDFSLPTTSGFTLAGGESEGITVCFKPGVVNQVLTEVLTLTFNNPASTPNTQTASVNLTGRSTTGIKPPWIDSCGIVGWYMNTISAPIDGSADATIELFNISNQPITLDQAVWEDGNTAGIYNLLTQLPITIQPHNPSVPSSGKASIQVRYAPTSQSSTVGVEDIATLRFESSVSSMPAMFFLTLIGTPVTPAPGSSTIVMFPKDGRIPQIELAEAEINSSLQLVFENNLQVPVTVTGLALSSDERFAVEDAGSLPRTVDPGETIAVKLRTKSVSLSRNTDALIMHGSHEHLNSRYNLISGSRLTNVDDTPGAPQRFAVAVAPNPAHGPVRITLSAPLKQGRVQVLDMLGRLVTEFTAETRTLVWDGATLSGRRAEAGTYYIRAAGVTVDGSSVSTTRKVVLLP